MTIKSAGTLPMPPEQWSRTYQAQLNRTVEALIIGNQRGGLRDVDGTSSKYVVRGYTITKILDLTTNPTQAEINDFVLTVIADIIQRGQIS